MTDMLVRLYALPALSPALGAIEARGVSIRRAMAYEYSSVLQWIASTFSAGWADEARLAFNSQPIGCYLAIKEEVLCGFCCIHCTYRNFLGPIGIVADRQGQGIGTALLMSGLTDMRAQGYAYAVIGCVSDPVFFQKAAGANIIDGSSPGPYFSFKAS